MSRFIRPVGGRIRKFLEYANLETKPHQVDGIKWCVKREALALEEVRVIKKKKEKKEKEKEKEKEKKEYWEVSSPTKWVSEKQLS